MSNTKNIINNIMKDNLVEAKTQINQELIKRVGALLESKIESIAPSMIAISEKDESYEKGERKKNVTRKMAMDREEEEDKKEKKNIKDDVEHVVDMNDELYDDDFEDFVDQIHEIVQEIENETGEELTEEEIISLGNDYLAFLNEEDLDEENLKGNQEKLDVAEPKGKLTGADFKKLRSNKGK